MAHRGLITLAIESSNPAPAPDPSRGGENENPWHGGVALIEGEREEACAPLGVERLRAERAGNERTGAFDDDLMPAIDRLCARAGVEPAQLGRIAVSVGPGGFTGLRIACAVAKSIAEATGAKLVGVPAAAGLIRGVAPEARDRGMVLIALAWKREDLWRVAFAPPGAHGSRLSVIPEGALTRLDRFLAAGPRGSGVIAAVVMDEALEARMRYLGLIPEAVAVLRPVWDPVALGVASLSLEAVDPPALAPIYPREPEAVTKWRALHGEGGPTAPPIH